MASSAIWLVAAIACHGACQGGGGGSGSGSAGSGPAVAPIDAAVVRDASAGFGTGGGSELDDAGAGALEDARKLDEPEPPPDPGKQIADLGAIPAWQAVIDRAQLLARRNQHGVVYGRIGPPIMVLGPTPDAIDGGVPVDAGMIASPYVWLVDDVEGNGALGLRVALGSHTAKAGDRVALGGAWALDETRRWYWKVDALQPIGTPATPSDVKDPPWPVPSHEIVMGNGAYGSKFVKYAKDNDAIYFQIVGSPPAREGDGWPIANELGDAPFAMLVLPGERSSYGGQDMRSPDERWQLKRAQTYWVRIGKIRDHGPGKPVGMTARTGPVRVN
jgi:hypothetical protein